MVITVGFIGYLAAGLNGAVVAAFATFLPCYLFTIIPAPHFSATTPTPNAHQPNPENQKHRHPRKPHPNHTPKPKHPQPDYNPKAPPPKN